MINIKIIGKGKDFQSLTIKGHANSNGYGRDLICAGVSSVVTGGFNSIKDVDNFQIILNEGYALLKAKKAISEYDEAVINTIITSLKTIEESNPSFVKIEIL